ncbi:MAG: TonB-dependent receptor [Myxococcales bacterium FL481]|nr:MAG: TonB-dependent receptor [Myxococcales bacterium FL481]
MLSAWAFAFGLLAPDSNPGVPAPCAATLRVRVSEVESGAPLGGAVLLVQPAGRPSPSQIQVSADGSVAIGPLCPGSVRITASHPHHSTASQVVIVSQADAALEVALSPLHSYHDERVVEVRSENVNEVETSETIAGGKLAETRGKGLADAVAGVSGVTALRGTGAGMAKPIIRGQIGRRNLIIVDGVRHAGQKWGLDHAPEVDPYSAGKITVVKGAGTTRYGPDALGGVVLLDSRPLPRGPAIAGEFTSTGLSNGLGGGVAGRFDQAPAWAPGFAYRVEGNYTQHRAAVAPDYPLDNTGSLGWNVGGKLGYLSARVDVEAGYRLLRSTPGICTCLRVESRDEFLAAALDNRPASVDLYRADFAIERPKQEIWHHLATAHTRVDLARAGELHARYAYQFNDRDEYDIVRQSITGPQMSFELATHTADVYLEQAAVDLNDSWSFSGTVGVTGGYQANDFDGALTLIPDYVRGSWGAFAVERLTSERFTFELGGRYEGMYRSASLQQRDYQGQVAADLLDPSICVPTEYDGGRCVHEFHTPSGALGVLIRPLGSVPTLRWRTELNSSARIPAIDEHYMHGAAPSFPLLGYGRSQLGVERLWGVGTGLRYSNAWLRTDVSGYANYVDEYIYFRPEPQTGSCAPLRCTIRGDFPVFQFRAVDALVYGGEAEIDATAPGLPFALHADAAWVRAHDLTSDEPVSLTPSDRYNLALRYLWPESRLWSAGYLEVRGTYVDRQRRSDPESDFAPPPPAFALLGASIGTESLVGEQLLRIGVDGDNLLNTRYREYTSLLRYFADEPGWSVRLRVGLEFNLAPGG